MALSFIWHLSHLYGFNDAYLIILIIIRHKLSGMIRHKLSVIISVSVQGYFWRILQLLFSWWQESSIPIHHQKSAKKSLHVYWDTIGQAYERKIAVAFFV